MHDLEHAMRRPVYLSQTDDAERAAILHSVTSGSSSTPSLRDWTAVEVAAVVAAEAVAAEAAAEVAREAAATAEAAVDVACAAAAKAARRAMEVAADAAEVVAVAVAVQQSRSVPVPAARAAARIGNRDASGSDRFAAPRQAAVDSAAAQKTEAQRVAGRVVLVAEAAATAAVHAALVVASQLDRDVAAVADLVAAGPSLAEAITRSACVSEIDVDATTMGVMAGQGASPHTIAAALNAAGSRTPSLTRWTATTVRQVLHLLTLPPDLLPVGAAGPSERVAHLLAVAEGARDQAEEALEEAQRLGGLGSWSWTVATNELTWSQQMHRLCGTDPETFPATYEGFLGCVHPDDRDHASASVAAVLEGAPVYESNYRVRHSNGDELWLHARGSAVRDAVGAPVRMYGTVIDVTAAKLAAERDRQQSQDLTRLATHDSLTGLANRSLLHDRLEHALAGRGPAVSVLMLDLDNFKTINDSAGHAAGDRLLVDVAARLSHTARAGHTVARLGGDEFAVVLEQGDPLQLAERILNALAVPVLIDGRQVTPTASIGIATAEGASGVDELLLQADVAMYAAKAAGKGRVKRFDAAMADAVRSRTDLLEGLREAVARREIVVHYQPIMDLGTESMPRVEALVRWQRPSGLVSPADFLPLAEETGLIVGIGKDVLRQSCSQLHGWLAADSRRSVSVNVSALQLLAGDFADHTLGVLRDTGVNPRQVVLEVTETLFLHITPDLIEQLHILRREGLRVSIDDFGTGYSSLGRLHRLPVDSIKIDKSFIDLIRDGEEFLPIVNSMIVMAHALNLDVTAEGVETPAQAAKLAALGCDYLQGFLFARPSVFEVATGQAAAQALSAWQEVSATSP